MDKSYLAKPLSWESKEYRDFIKTKPCLRCGVDDGTITPHHEPFRNTGIGTKCPDSQCVPLCGVCHHRRHNPKPFEEKGFFWHGIDVKWEMIKLLTEYLGKLKG